MDKQTLSLGERILLATRLAVEEHLLQDVRDQMQPQRQDAIGGADWTCPDGLLLFGMSNVPEGKAA